MEKTLFENLKGLIFHYRKRFLLALIMLIVSNVLLILNPLVFRQAITALGSNTSFQTKSVVTWAFLLILIAAISSIFRYTMRMAFISISRDAEKEIRAKLFDRIQGQSRAFFDRHGIGELLSRLTNDISSYREVSGPGIMFPLFFLTLVFPGMIALFTISVPLAALSLVPLILIPLLNEALRGHSYRLSLAVQTALGELSNFVQEHFFGIRIVKSYSIEKSALARFKQQCKEFATLNFKMSCLQGLLYPIFTLLTKIITVLLVLLAGFIILHAWQSLSIGDFLSFMWIQSYIFFPILMLGWILPIYERGRASYTRMVEIYEEPNEIKDNPHSTLKIPPKADIVFKDLTFFYPGADTPALSHLNLHIKGGSLVGITGPVGAGKTTLLQLLNREYEIPSGTLFIGSHEVHEYSLKAFRAEMVAVEQASFLFSRTLAENVRFGRAEASQEELETVARYADLHDTIMELPEKYNTTVGERGMTLSGGQKQRVAMARAFLVNRSILLLDDIFSAVDADTEHRIFQSIQKYFSGRTILMVSHRVSILDKMDRVIYMMNGQIEEDGAPKELRALKGHYAALADLQQSFIGEP